jgi:hypothetical protein
MPTWKGQEVVYVSVAVPADTHRIVSQMATLARKPIDEVVVSLMHAGLHAFVDNPEFSLEGLDAATAHARVVATMLREERLARGGV